MAFLNSLDISGSGLTASRLRMDIISENIANSDTTRTENGGPYRRKMVVYDSENTASFKHILTSKQQASSQSRGVKVTKIMEDSSEFSKTYDPTHPDADEEGYVLMPNVDPVKETLDMMAVTRAYDNNLAAFNAVKSMASKALDMGR